MDFSQALTLMRAGKYVARPHWLGCGLFLIRSTKQFVVFNQAHELVEFSPYHPDVTTLHHDLLALDWLVVPRWSSSKRWETG